MTETARDTLDWQRASNGLVVGLTPREESDVLAAWHARSPS
jgi:hypothetical protein